MGKCDITVSDYRSLCEPSMALDVKAAGCDYREEMTCDNSRVLASQLDYQTCDYTQVAWSCIPKKLHSTIKCFR